VDSVWEQNYVEALKMLENGAESPASGARFVSTTTVFYRIGYLADNGDNTKTPEGR
jgi:hypothetical protein